jgi:hypothetical protein
MQLNDSKLGQLIEQPVSHVFSPVSLEEYLAYQVTVVMEENPALS